MMRRSCPAPSRGRAFLLALLLMTVPAVALAQAVSQVAPDTASQPEPSLAELRDRVEARYQVLPLRGGIALLPKYGDTDVQSLELSDGQIAVNGAPVTGAELDQRVGADAADIRRLSFMDADARRVLFGIGPSPATAEGIVPDTTAADTTLAEEEEEEEEDYENQEGIDVGGSGDRVRVGAGISVAEGEVIDGDVVSVGGSVRVDGTVGGDVVAVGGGVHLGPNAVVDGEVTSVGGTIERDPGAVVRGTVNEVAFAPHFGWRSDWGPGPFFAGVTGLIGTIVWIAVLILLACLAYLFARRPIERMEYRVGTSAWKAALVGLVAQLLFIPALVLTCVVLAISIIGIPFLLLVPFAILALVIGSLLGFTAVAKRLGNVAEDRFGWHHASPYISLLVGIGLIMLLSFFGHALGVAGGPLKVFGAVLTVLGFIAQYVAWTIGLGVLLLTRFGTRYRWSDGDTPEPVPSPPPLVPATHEDPGASTPPPTV